MLKVEVPDQAHPPRRRFLGNAREWTRCRFPDLRSVGKLCAITLALTVLLPAGTARGQDDLTSERVLKSIESARNFLLNRQKQDGSWEGESFPGHRIGITSLSLLAVINSGLTKDDEAVRNSLKYLRSQPTSEPGQTYDLALAIMALAAANEPRDRARIFALAQRLENGQVSNGPNSGLWSYFVGKAIIDGPGDPSNGQYAVLGLREAATLGYPVKRDTWQRIQQHWRAAQNGDGSWSYAGRRGGSGTGSMTVAGIATLTIVHSMLRDEPDLKPDGTPNCCLPIEEDEHIARAVRWLERNFAVGNNPGSGMSLLYYIYGLERAGRLSGRRYFGNHDWYREGAKYLIGQQSQRLGSWKGIGIGETDPIIGTSFALLFLSKGLAPVIISKLNYAPDTAQGAKGPAESGNWNQHPDDVRNLTEHITTLPKWPKLLTTQVIEMPKVLAGGGVRDLLQSPVVYLSGVEDPASLYSGPPSGRGDTLYDKMPRQVRLLREYVDQGGFLFAVQNCNGAGFDDGFRRLVAAMYPDGEAKLERLDPGTHEVYRSENLLDPSTELWGVNLGCRTGIIYAPSAPTDLSCLWDRWAVQDPPRRTPAFKIQIRKALNVGVNVVAYATGREPPDKIRNSQIAEGGENEKTGRGVLQIAQLKYPGRWDTAPRALRNLLIALNRTVGLEASTKDPLKIVPTDKAILRFPMVYMHGRASVEFSADERKALQAYLKQGGFLFADSCCSSRQFDQSFRDLVQKLFPGKKLEELPRDHEIFTDKVGFDIRNVRRRTGAENDDKGAIRAATVDGPPVLEGIKIDNRYVILYSRYDLSCALERQASVACPGYTPDDAVKIAVNMVLYALLQDARWLNDVRAMQDKLR